MKNFQKKIIFRAIIIALIGAFILWLISLFSARNRIKEDEKEIMKFLIETEKTQNKSFD